MEKLSTISDKLNFIKWKCENENTSASDKLDIIEFLINHTGMFGKTFNYEKFMNELNKLTKNMNKEQIK